MPSWFLDLLFSSLKNHSCTKSFPKLRVMLCQISFHTFKPPKSVSTNGREQLLHLEFGSVNLELVYLYFCLFTLKLTKYPRNVSFESQK